ncbi:phosphocholine cytidylyltransferase family protein [Desulfovibrio sp. UCD-KL4C]|uniref:phosphocholine cytidylyltransferase family protein n=1 Tax=Desulfovibrio sp. UCD-KL4C TaxID=2578120 RepID=UPI0025C2C562|nr:phosphocholine cytidylyltransferase family protein [Desulfovibrio sp. UCD-KL4C]
MQAIILAAGRGSRMKEATKDLPKCLVELMGKPLLHWQLEALRKGGSSDILVVRGYLAEKLSGDFSTVDNLRWADSNMVETMRHASAWLGKGPSIIAYSDIVYSAEHVQALNKSKYDISITYDSLWENLWKIRFEDPLSDAETFREADGKLLEIGGKATSIDEIKGQYMGLLRLTSRGWAIFSDLFSELGQKKVDKLDMTALLRLLLDKGIEIGAVSVAGKWAEVDSMEDLIVYENILAQTKAWSHDWR